MSITRRLTAAVASLVLLSLPVACGGGGSAEGGNSITVWTTDTLPDRVAKTKAIIKDFTKKTGIKVKLVGVAEDQMVKSTTAAAAAGDLPDVMGGLSLGAVRTLAANDLVDTEAVGSAIQSLGPRTFSEQTLNLTSEGDTRLAVPSDIWSQLLIYRKDLFRKAGLAPPETYEDVLKAAKELDGGGMAGFVGPTAAGDAFTQQTFEHFALANGCQMVNEAGEITLDSPQCVGAFDFYGKLASSYSLPGSQDVDTVRAAYFSGKAAMIPWSTFILDELAGLRDDAKPTCPQCKDDPAYLAKNSGFVTALRGPDGREPAQFGEVVSWTIPAGGASDSAQRFVEFMMSKGYVDWTAIAPEGKYPARRGTQSEPTKFVDAWETLPVGVDQKAPLSKFYSEDVFGALRGGPKSLERWGVTQGQGNLVGAMQGELPIPKAVAALTSGEADAAGATEEATRRLRSIQKSLK